MRRSGSPGCIGNIGAVRSNAWICSVGDGDAVQLFGCRFSRPRPPNPACGLSPHRALHVSRMGQSDQFGSVRDERVERVTARENPDVDDGWLLPTRTLRLPGISRAGASHRAARARRRAAAPRKLGASARRRRGRLARAGAATAAPGRRRGDERGGLSCCSGSCARRSEAATSTHAAAGRLDPRVARLLSHPRLGAKVSDIERADVVLAISVDPLQEMPILDLRVRKAVRRLGTRLVSSPRAIRRRSTAARANC